MLRNIASIAHGYIIWRYLVYRYHIKKNDAVLMLPDNNKEWNICGIKFLPSYMEKKMCNRALIFETKKNGRHIDAKFNGDLEFHILKRKQMRDLLSYYCLYRFFDNIVLLFIREPRDNRSEFALKNTSVSLEELICIGIYRLQKVPVNV